MVFILFLIENQKSEIFFNFLIFFFQLKYNFLIKLYFPNRIIIFLIEIVFFLINLYFPNRIIFVIFRGLYLNIYFNKNHCIFNIIPNRIIFS